MERTPITSSNLKAVGYDAPSKTLEVEFQSGAVHQYFGVPKVHYNGLVSGKSPGSYFHLHIKSGGYRSKPVS